MTKRELTCIVCPRGCQLVVELDGKNVLSVSGNICKRGKVYAENEFIRPLRILTSSVKTESAATPLVAVRTSAPIPKEMQMAAMEEVKKITVSGKLVPGDVIVENFMGLGVNLVASGSIE